MNYSDLIKTYGDEPGIVAKLKVSRQLVAHWRERGISDVRQAWIQVKTRGRLRADAPKKPNGKGRK